MTVTEVQWSELQRDPKSVAALADQGDVHVRRRDGAALLLTRADRAATSADGAVHAARALRNLLSHLPHEALEAAAQSLKDEFPWVDVLPESDRRQFVIDFSRAFQVSAELGQWHPLEQTIREWHNTAAVHADPELAASLSEPIDGDFGPVPSPSGTSKAGGPGSPTTATGRLGGTIRHQRSCQGLGGTLPSR